VVSAMVEDERYWGAMTSFCEDVISQKEAAERDRESAPDADLSRRKRGGGRGDGNTPVSSSERSISVPPFPN